MKRVDLLLPLSEVFAPGTNRPAPLPVRDGHVEHAWGRAKRRRFALSCGERRVKAAARQDDRPISHSFLESRIRLGVEEQRLTTRVVRCSSVVRMLVVPVMSTLHLLDPEFLDRSLSSAAHGSDFTHQPSKSCSGLTSRLRYHESARHESARRVTLGAQSSEKTSQNFTIQVSPFCKINVKWRTT